jgi:hypothetical protein
MDASSLAPTGPPTERAQAIESSISCLIHGVAGMVLPVLGLVPAVSALVSWITVSRRYRGQWNPAGHYLKAGGILGVLGVLSNTILVAAIAFAVQDGLFK